VGGEGRARHVESSTVNSHLFINLTAGLQRVRDNLMKTLGDLNKQKGRFKGDDNLAAEVSRLEGALIVARDDMVKGLLVRSPLKAESLLFLEFV
jgi:hypothetical protein